MEEKELIYKAKNGNKHALNELLSQNYNTLLGYCIKMTGNPTLAQDIVQDTMLKAILNIKKFAPEAKFSTWLLKIATNTFKDYLRKHKNVELVEEISTNNTENIEETAITNLQYKELMNILMKLPYEKRATFILKHYYGYKYEEIAQILDCPVGTVRSRLHNAIKEIMKEMERRDLL
ncbi:RNA polymerase sigma factor SigY [Caldanaerobacter subterraneus subsp. yonseiensis KB-1]|uniref:RNA polymerase sigma factor n=1 Tax=Caldanaerobacter subterraneus subsp. yonseiensis KB-1 TaxID=1388761 RepID=U5CQD7_CALSX|nr:RNA polymerase sigma factor SigY [Caldanaerobacter subterraneus]ERM91994.1 RNA polymerase sigma factor SigY [Caldanaerobacter subterraneus subsp. yonseiensis KB-1]MBE3593158.1 RNA polymerase sigma factor SigY [Thermoanaerobacter sp.]